MWRRGRDLCHSATPSAGRYDPTAASTAPCYHSFCLRRERERDFPISLLVGFFKFTSVIRISISISTSESGDLSMTHSGCLIMMKQRKHVSWHFPKLLWRAKEIHYNYRLEQSDTYLLLMDCIHHGGQRVCKPCEHIHTQIHYRCKASCYYSLPE